MSAYTAVSQETIITETLKVWSISNQRQILMDYVREKGWTLIDCYVDVYNQRLIPFDTKMAVKMIK